ncbi:hypothetical protein GP486_006049 [Trichoglossum hirsutum]|uniref:Heterokaryon incompatibility domain-containing protein n=1 Tax=Trichoglossum hirsutum TaxID=265104 RepID=A0A9P8RLH8_9PEZI|nr:hypothetical protein GP486_006049 [Trichoglossum hirsutum]
MEGVLAAEAWTVASGRLKVPFVALTYHRPSHSPSSDDDDGPSFYDFPRHNGFALRTDDAKGLFAGCGTIGALTSLLQSWLFFELLAAFLERRDIDRNDFEAYGFVDIDQARVHGYFRDWRAGLSRRSYAGKQTARKRLERIIEFAMRKSEMFEEAADLFESADADDEDFDRVALSVKLLIGLLISISDDTFSIFDSQPSAHWASSRILHASKAEPEPSDKPLLRMDKEEPREHLHTRPKWFLPLPPDDYHGGRAAKRFLRLFADNGWCPYQARQLCRSYDYLTLNSLASLKCHQTSIGDHGQCMQLGRCCAHDLTVDPASGIYPFQHAIKDEHDCEFIHVPKEEIADIIKSGDIPLISLSLGGDDLDLKVVRCTPHVAYTAISHVWSDGLGNPKSNALPRCQLFRLREMILQTYSPGFIPCYDDRTLWSRFKGHLNADWRAFINSSPGRQYIKINRKRVLFWMDTLCIPVSSDSYATEEDEDLKFRAMRHMTPIFAGAFNTLVLDRRLQDAGIPVPSQANEDELAALVLSSKWMQRGWALEEGSLAQGCVFQLMGEQYEMPDELGNSASSTKSSRSDLLRNLLSNVESRHSPLDRAFINARQSIPLLLGRALLHEKRQFSVVSLFPRSLRLAKRPRTPQFVWTWNSLLERSTTKPEDGPIIFANMLDFNVYPLKLIPRQERLPLLVQNCDELPLSLLYNTGPRICIKGHPELGWIPRDIAGDHLVDGAALRRINSEQNNQVEFLIDRSNSNLKSTLILRTSHGQCIPYDVETFVVRDGTNTTSNGRVDQEYFVQIQRNATQGPDDNEIQSPVGEIHGQSMGTCIVIDLACGTPSVRGFAGRGARFYVDSHNQGDMTLRYDAPLIAWTAEQWQHKCNNPPTPSHCFDTVQVACQQRLLLNFARSQYRVLGEQR